MSEEPYSSIDESDLSTSASEWFVRLADKNVTHEQRLAFRQWINEDPRHVAAYQRMQQVWMLSSQAKEHFKSSVPNKSRLAFLYEKLSIGLHTGFEKISSALQPAYIVPVCTGLVVVLSVLWWNAGAIEELPAVTYATTVAETRTVDLIDGSSIDLNSTTSLRVAVTKQSRRVIMDSGEAYFSITPDKDHPFIVQVGERNIRVIGTEFNITFLNQRAEVTVTKGVVEVTGIKDLPWTAEKDKRVLVVGEQVHYRNKFLLSQTKEIETDHLIQWRKKRFVFRETPLPEVAKQLSQFYGVNITVPILNASRFLATATFQHGDLKVTLAKLEKLLPINIAYINQGHIEISWDSAKEGM